MTTQALAIALLLGQADVEQAYKKQCAVPGEFQQTHWGMSPNQVKTIYPLAEVYQTGAEPVLIDKSFISLSGFSVNEVIFTFSGKKLNSVAVHFKLPPADLPHEKEAERVHKLMDALVLKYGFALMTTPDKPLPGNVQMYWSCSKTNLALIQATDDGHLFLLYAQPKKNNNPADGL